MRKYVEDADFTLWQGDALEVLREMPYDCADACVTSPPYLDARSEYGSPSLEEFDLIFHELGRVIVPTGSIMLNVGRLFRDGRELRWWHELLVLAERSGWQQIDTLIWSKTNPAGKGSPYLTNAHEYVFWLGTPQSYRGFDDARRPYSPESLARFQRAPRPPAKNDPTRRPGTPPHPLGAKPWSVFSCPVGQDKGNEHPAPMARQLAEHLVKLCCPSGGTVIDPFAGSGTTALVARKHNRRSVLIELNEDYCQLAATRLQQLSLLAEPA